MITVAQGSLGENLKLDWMRTPHTTVVVPVTATAANKARSSKGRRFHIDGPSLPSSALLFVLADSNSTPAHRRCNSRVDVAVHHQRWRFGERIHKGGVGIGDQQHDAFVDRRPTANTRS